MANPCGYLTHPIVHIHLAILSQKRFIPTFISIKQYFFYHRPTNITRNVNVSTKKIQSPKLIKH